MKIPAHRIVFTEKEILKAQSAVRDAMSTGSMILGKYTQAFEEAYAALHGRKHGIAVASDTAAIEIALRYYGIGEGDKVLFPANGFYGVVIPVLRCGATPIFFDIDIEENVFAHESTIERMLDKHRDIKALILMHTGGLVASRSKEIGALCKKRRVICIEDAAHAPGARMNGEYAGSFGDASCFSLYATKPINAGEGGIILTDDEVLCQIARVYRNYGRVAEFGTSICKYQGYSWRITEIQAAIGLEQVKRQDEIRAERSLIAARYHQYITPLLDVGIERYEFAQGSEPNWYRYLMLLPKARSSKDKIKLKDYAVAKYGVSIPGDVYEMPVPHQPVWDGKYNEYSFPNAQEWGDRHFSLPLYNTLNTPEQKHVVKAVLESYLHVGGGRTDDQNEFIV